MNPPIDSPCCDVFFQKTFLVCFIFVFVKLFFVRLYCLTIELYFSCCPLSFSKKKKKREKKEEKGGKSRENEGKNIKKLTKMTSMQFTFGSKLMSVWGGNLTHPQFFWSPHPLDPPPYENTLMLPLLEVNTTVHSTKYKMWTRRVFKKDCLLLLYRI